ncbi:ras-related protein Rap-2a-like [Bolinopsis microptera]|uniref:ras-related protein Rap-2a-like n=1 Tax=Bolinopsis microptera TaxID=2820187 RepID=UPI00307AA334
MKEYKVVVLGSGGVGKSAITLRYVQGLFVARYNPTVEDFYRHHARLDEEEVMVEILDTAGTEQYSSMHQLYIDHGQAFVLVYAIDNKQSFRDVEPLLNQILDMKNERHFPIIVAGNKSDREEYREVDREHVERTAKDVWLVPHIHTSAKEDLNVGELFRRVLRMIKSYQDKQQAVKRKQYSKKSSGCCVLL